MRKSDGQTSSTRPVYGMDGEMVTSDDAVQYPVSHKIFAILFTTALMLWYGYKNQIVRLPRAGSHGNQEEEEEDYWE